MAGAKRPDGKAAKTERVTFTRPAADRIGRVVRIVEAGDRGSAGLTFTPRVAAPVGIRFRICTFTGSWSTAATKTLTLKHQTATPNTLSVTNLTFYLPDIGTGPYDCVVGKEGTAWFLVSAVENNTKRGTFVAPWSKGATRTITLTNGGSVTAVNRHGDVAGESVKNCTVARDGMDWELIAAEC